MVKRTLHTRLAVVFETGQEADVLYGADGLLQDGQLAVGFPELLLQTDGPFSVLLATESKPEMFDMASAQISDR